MPGHLSKDSGDGYSCPSHLTAFLGDLSQARCRLPMVLSNVILLDNPVCGLSAPYLPVCEMERVILWCLGADFAFSAKTSCPSYTSLLVWWPCLWGHTGQQGPWWEKQDQRVDPPLLLHLKPAQSRGSTGRSPHLSEMCERETSTASSKHSPCFEQRSEGIPALEWQKDGTNLARSAAVFPEAGRQLAVKINTA